MVNKNKYELLIYIKINVYFIHKDSKLNYELIWLKKSYKCYKLRKKQIKFRFPMY